MKRISLILSLVLFIALCATLSFWVLQFIKPEPRKVSAPPMIKPVADVESVAGLFGGALAVNTTYQLKGIVLANPSNQSGAIIAIDGKATQAYRIDAEISPGVKLSEVHANYILILDSGVSKRIDLPQDFKSSGTPDSVLLRPPALPSNSAAPDGRGNISNSPPGKNLRHRGPQLAPSNANSKSGNDTNGNPGTENQ